MRAPRCARRSPRRLGCRRSAAARWRSPANGREVEWTLNWDPMVFDDAGAIENPTEEQLNAASLIIGSCPRSPEDIDRLVDEGGVEAIICLQCTLCHGALKIDWEPIRKRALERGVTIVASPSATSIASTRRRCSRRWCASSPSFKQWESAPYVHCTAGINRASLTVLGYLTFVRGMTYDHALGIVRECRPQANPYALSWNIARRAAAGGAPRGRLPAHPGGSGREQQRRGRGLIARDLEAAHIGVIQNIFERHRVRSRTHPGAPRGQRGLLNPFVSGRRRFGSKLATA